MRSYSPPRIRAITSPEEIARLDRVFGVIGRVHRTGWIEVKDDVQPWLEIRGRECSIFLMRRPAHCDRGNWYALVEPDPRSQLALSLDEADGFPRYYFDLDRAKLELEAWLKRRGQFVE